jgi:hypothetical protein
MKRIFVIAALLLTACTGAARLSAPAGFAEMEDGKPYSYRAQSAHGIVVAVRAEKNSPRANVDFWADAIDLRMRRQGYVADSAKPVRSSSGLAGKQIRYSREDERRTYRYWLTVFTTDDKVFVVEAAGDKDAFDPQVKTVEDTVLSLRT